MEPPANTDGGAVLAQFNRLIEELLAGKMQRSNFQAWEIDILLDAKRCNLSRFAKAGLVLRRYQEAVHTQLANGAHLPMKLSEFLASSRGQSRRSAQA